MRLECIRFNANDVLVHIDEQHPKLFSCGSELQFSVVAFPKRIITETAKTIKETGVNPLCLAQYTVGINFNEKTFDAPLFLMPLSYKINKKNATLSFQKMEDELFVNPFLIYHITHQLELKLPEIEELVDWVEVLEKLDFNVNKEVEGVIGNFHHHRYQIIKELDDLLAAEEHSAQLHRIFGEETEEITLPIELVPNTLLDADTDHENVFREITNGDVVIQGPPGTGKSQVLTNVIAKLLAGNYTTIVVSEKRVALEVIKNKLATFGLDKLCYIASSDHSDHAFMQELKATWDFFETYTDKIQPDLRLSEQLKDQLQMTLDMLHNEDLIGGVSFQLFKEASAGISLEKFAYNSQVDSVASFLKNKEIIRDIYTRKLNSVVGGLKSQTIASEGFYHLDQKVATWLKSVEQISEIFGTTSWQGIKTLMKEAVQCQIFENEYYKKYSELFVPDSKNQKEFLRLKKKYQATKIELERIQKNRSQWKIIPSEMETISLLQTSENGTFFSRIKFNRRWKEISHLPVKFAATDLKQHLANCEVINNFTQLTIKFCELGIENPEIDVEQIDFTIHALTKEQWQDVQQIPVERRLKITDSHQLLTNLQREISTYFNVDETQDLGDFLRHVKTNLSDLIGMKEVLQQLSSYALSALGRNPNFEAYQGELFASHWAQFKDRFPVFSNFSMNDIAVKIDEIGTIKRIESTHFARSIVHAQHAVFSQYHKLLNTPARKLSEEEREKKTRLRKGKSLLVKEFSKTRSHPSLREMYNSEAREWIQLLKPIWLSNPAQLAKCFPMEMNLFDVAIFDEASQIPLENALGAIQRSKRIVIAGDEHQMGPSSYFKSGSTEPMDVLHQANYYLKQTPLHHHYRSKHPALIQFSNTHFYDGKLKAYPSFNGAEPLHHHFVEGATFIDRRNSVEAKYVAQVIENRLKEKGSIGIVAFSEEQLQCIWEQLSVKVQTEITNRLENGEDFFKALENVQGDECDHLIISFGYGKNEDSEFHMRFGPLNTANGRKRLNVLLTRATTSIDFCCSVQSSDFKLSENESVNLLRQWFRFSESEILSGTPVFPYQLTPTQNKNQLTFRDIHKTLPTAEELVTLQQVLQQRGWVVQYK